MKELVADPTSLDLPLAAYLRITFNMTLLWEERLSSEISRIWVKRRGDLSWTVTLMLSSAKILPRQV